PSSSPARSQDSSTERSARAITKRRRVNAGLCQYTGKKKRPVADGWLNTLKAGSKQDASRLDGRIERNSKRIIASRSRRGVTGPNSVFSVSQVCRVTNHQDLLARRVKLRWILMRLNKFYTR